MIGIGVLGANGRMGQAIITDLREYPDMKLVAAYARGAISVDLEDDALVCNDHDTVFATADVILDFTSPYALEAHLHQAALTKKPLIVGTTGLDKEHKQLLAQAGKHIPLVYAENTSTGANLMIYLVKHVAAFLDESFDVEILEVHHRHKVDALSGTALALGRAVARGRNIDFEGNASLSRSNIRRPQSIGFSAQRGGSIVGEHTVSFFGDEESFSLTHRNFSRSVLAKGALRAATWIVQQPPGLYTMADVLGLHELFTH
ncbi:MAG: 4-hydroxy-tetrahydrodipicolinate reductase [Alphaproteobacteria bacterium]